MRFRIGLILIGISGFFQAKGQIQDDTTKVIYGPTSTRYILEERLYLDDPAYNVLDTTLYDQHRMSKIEQNKYRLIDLGLEGTTIRELWYKTPRLQGVDPGFNGFSYYVKRPNQIRYYDTRSPYSRISAVLGGNNRAFTNVQFSRSDSINFNFGFDFFKILNERQLNRIQRGDKEVEDTQYDIYAHFKTNNLKYQALFNYSRDRHIYFETGGIAIVDSTLSGGIFNDDNTTYRLTTAESIQLHRNFHLYHQYMITDWLEVFNIVNWGKQVNEYKDSDPDPEYYDRFYFSETQTADSTQFDYLTVFGGLKGRYKNLHYNGYYGIRDYSFIYKYADADTLAFDSLAGNKMGTERYVGFLAAYDLPRDHKILGGMSQLEGKFDNYIELRGPNFTAKWQKMLHKPSFLHQAYIGNHRFWVNNFTDVQADKVTGRFKFDVTKYLEVAPVVDYSVIKNHIYFDTDTLPAQFNGTIKTLSPGFEFRAKWRDMFVLEGEWIRTEILQDSLQVMQIPRDFVYARLHYHDFYFKGALEAMFGIEGNWKSPYFAYAYDPVVQQYYLQRDTQIDNFAVINLFMNFRITRATFFVKFNNLGEWLGQDGYLVAPDHRGLRAAFDFGFNWWFFD